MVEISIIISFYRPSTKSHFVFEKVIENLLSQSFTDFEILIFDDAGNDQKAIDFVKKLKDPRIRFEQFEQNSGHRPTIRYNYGVSKATGKYILYAFEDDIIHLDALKLLKDALESNNVDFSYARTIIHTPNGQLTFGIPGDVTQIKKFNFIPNNLLLHKRSIIDDIGYQDASKEANQDCDWKYWQKMMEKGYKGAFVPLVLGENFGPIFKTNIRQGK